MIEEATVDGHGEGEQATAFLTNSSNVCHWISNRRFPRPKSAEWIAAYLHARQVPDSRAIEYRHLVADAIHAAPFSKRRVSVPDAAAVIVEYTRSTGDASRTVDLMLTFAEAGTEQAAD